MAFLGSIGRFFGGVVRHVHQVIDPVPVIGPIFHAQAVQGFGLAEKLGIHVPTGLTPPHRQLSAAMPPSEINPDTRLQSFHQGPFVQTPFTSGAYFQEVEFGQRPSNFYGEEP